MATNVISSLNWSLDGGTIDIFGCRGAKMGADWLINILGSLMAQVSPDSMMPQIRDIIASDVANGNGDKIAQLLLAPRQAVVFYLEGALTLDQLKASTEGIGFIEIPNVDIDGRSLTVRILEEAEYTVATADANGDII